MIRILNILSRIVFFIRKFDFDIKENSRGLRIVTFIFVLILFSISLLFVFKAFKAAEKKDIWLDEAVALRETVRNYRVNLIISGGQGEGSPAPLDYIVVRVLDMIRLKVKTFYLSFNVYYRLSSIFANCISGFIAALFVFLHIKKKSHNYIILLMQVVFLYFAVIVYYFWPFNFQYAIELRPYALWNSIWFMLLVDFLLKGQFKWEFRNLLILLAATQTAAVFQMASFAVGYLVFRIVEKEDIKEIMKKILKTFFIPFCVSLYYISCKQSGFNYAAGFDVYLKQFFDFWLTKEMIPVLTITGMLLTVGYKNMRHVTTVFFVMFLLYLVSPIINYVILSHNFFFSSRHYIYYDLVYPIFLISFAVMLPKYFESAAKYFKIQESN